MGKPPSRKKYEENNPIVNFRIDKEIKEELEEMLEDIDMTKKDWIESRVREDTEIYKEAEKMGSIAYLSTMNEGHERGYSQAENKYKLHVPCDVCGEPMTVDDEDLKDKISEIIQAVSNLDRDKTFDRYMDPYEDIPEWTWGHASCHE